MDIFLCLMQLWISTICIHEVRLLLYILWFVNKQFMHLDTGEYVSDSYRFIRSWLAQKLSKLCICISSFLPYSYMSVKWSSHILICLRIGLAYELYCPLLHKPEAFAFNALFSLMFLILCRLLQCVKVSDLYTNIFSLEGEFMM